MGKVRVGFYKGKPDLRNLLESLKTSSIQVKETQQIWRT